MAINIISNPLLYNTANNPNIWVINSDNKLLTGFKYVVVVKDSTTNAIIKTIEVAPRPFDGYGEFNLSKTLSEYINPKLDLPLMKSSLRNDLKNWRIRYKLEFGERYITSWVYTDTEFYSGDTVTVQSVPTINPFQIGDSVVITPNNPSLNPIFQGLFKVKGLDPVSGFPFFESPFVSTALNPGTIRFSDNRATRTLVLLTSTTFELWNGVIDFNKCVGFPFNSYLLNGPTKLFWTNFKSGFRINYDQDIFVPLICDTNIGLTAVFTRDDSTVYSVAYGLNANLNNIKMINLTPRVTIGGVDLFVPTMKYYDVHIKRSSDDVIVSKPLRIYVDPICLVSNIEILFEDRKGAYSSFTFGAQSQYDLNVVKDKFNKSVEYTGSTYDPIGTDSGTTIVNIDYSREYTLRTKTIKNREQDLYFEELLTSKNTFVKIDGVYQRCDVLTSDASFKSLNQTGLRRREIKIKLSNRV